MSNFSIQSFQKSLILVFVLMMCSCATTHRYKAWKHQKNPVFMCTKTDLKSIENPLEPVTFWWPESYLPMWISVPIVTIVDIGMILDIPISLVVDTVCLPADLNQRNKHTQIAINIKKKAVPMYAKIIRGLNIPEIDEPIGFDLEKGDWVAPYGSGIISDFIFTCNHESKSYNEFKVVNNLSFSNKNDGIQLFEIKEENRNDYLWPYDAPLDGYQKSLTKSKFQNWQGVTKSNLNSETNRFKKAYYIFRVRTKVDNEGNIISASYGKIEDEISISRKPTVSFIYYFNPDGTRNLVFNPKENLFKWDRREADKYAPYNP